mmetsp:Transcript_33588/g.62946  ORF Transcript_33588/g.62946 Transcript_33588/m.62946 type:complete len:187 (+) Transcript_33588:65-625(+)
MYAYTGLGTFSAPSAMSPGAYSLPPARSEAPRSEGFTYCPGQTLKMTAQLQVPEPLNWSAAAAVPEIRPPPGLAVPNSTNKAVRPVVAEPEADGHSEPDVPHSSSASTADTEHAGAQVAAPVLNPAEAPTRGSAGHGLGACKPCAFVFKDGCQSGFECQFCHLCPPGEKIRRKKELKQRRKLNKKQ